MPLRARPPLVLCLALVGCLGACALSSTHVEVVGPMHGLQGRAERVFRLPLDAAAVDCIALEVRHGRLECTAGDKDFEVVAELEMWARTDAEAAKTLEGFELAEGREGGTLSVRLRGEPLQYGEGGDTTRIWPRARVKARVPRGLRLEAKSDSGDVRVQGPLGVCALFSGYGGVIVDDVAGVRAETYSGSIEARRVRGEVRLRSGYGKIELAEATAKRVTIETASGDVRVHEVDAETIVATSSYGSIEALRSRGDLKLTTASGRIAVESAGDGRHELETGYGTVSFRGGGGELLASSRSGDVEISGFAGKVRLGTAYGAIQANGTFTAMRARSESGRVRVTAEEGSQAAAPWHLSSGYGDVELAVPKSFSCELLAKTERGRVETDEAVTIARGAFDGLSLRGTIGAGGSTVEVTSSSGDVRLRRASARQ